MSYRDVDRLRSQISDAVAHHNALREALVAHMAVRRGTARRGAPQPLYPPRYQYERPDPKPPIGNPEYERIDWPRLLHPIMRRVLGPRAFGRWCLWRLERT